MTSRLHPDILYDYDRNIVTEKQQEHSVPYIQKALTILNSSPVKIADTARDPIYLQIGLDALSIASQASSHQSITLMSFLLIPFSLYHAFVDAKHNIKLLIQSCKIYQFANAIFFGFNAINACGAVLGTIAKGINGSMQIDSIKKLIDKIQNKTFTNNAVKGLNLATNLIIPVILIVVSVIGMVSAGIALWKTKNAYKKLSDQKNVLDALHYLQGPNKLKTAESEIARELFITTHALNQDHYDEIQEKITSVLKKQSNLVLELTKITQINQKFDDLNEINELINSIDELTNSINNDPEDSAAKIDDLIKKYQELLKKFENMTATETISRLYASCCNKLTLLQSCRDKYQKIQAEGQEVIDQVKADMMRSMIGKIVDLNMSILTLVCGILALVYPHHLLVWSYLGTATTVVDLMMLIGNKSISMTNWHKINLFLSLPRKIHHLPELNEQSSS